MLRKKELLDFIGMKLAHLKAYVATMNAVRCFDSNVVAEDFFASLMNAVYGYSLINLNHVNLNAVAVDLGDKVRRIAVQVTSERTKSKVQWSIDRFAENGLSTEYDTLKVLIIGDRTGDYPTLAVPTGVTFTGKNDVIDVAQLMKDIGQLGVSDLERIADLIRRELKNDSAESHTDNSGRAAFDQIDANQREILKQQATQSRQTAHVADSVNELRSVVTALPVTMLPDALASVHQSVLDFARDLLIEHKPSQALALLEKQKSAIWITANGQTKARLLSAMAGGKLAIGSDSEAAQLFLEARQYNPEDEKVLSNVAIGYLLLGDRNSAATTAQLVLERNPANFQAHSVLIQSSEEPLEAIIDELPEFCRTNCEVALALGFVARRRGDLAAAKKWFRIALENDSDGHPDIKGMLAEVILHGFTDDPASPVRIGQIDEASRSELEQSVTLFNEACDTFQDESALRTRIAWLLNAAVASRLLGRKVDIDEYLSRAKRLAPAHPAVVYQCAVAAHDREDLATAIDLAKTLKVSDEVPHAPIFLAQLLWQGDRIDEAIDVLQVFVDTTPADLLAKSAKQMLIELHMAKDQLPDALRLSNEVITIDPTDVSSLVIASQVHRSMGHADDADASLEKALRVVVDATPSSHLFLLGNELGVAERWPEAAVVFEKVVDTTVDSPLTRKYLHACYQASKLDKALDVCQRLRAQHGPQEFITEIEIAILEETGDLLSARSVCEQFVAAFPNDGKKRIQLAVVYLRAHDYDALDSFLNNPPDWRPLPVECGQQIAQLYSARKRYREAIQLLYEIRRSHSQGKVHLQYLQTFLFQDDQRHEWLEVHEAGIDVAVGVKDSSNEVQWFIVEDRTDSDIARGELTSTHPLAKELVGKKPGDSVLLKTSSMSSEQGTITEIKSKYLHAFHESAKVFEVRYPEQSGQFVSMKLSEGKEGVEELLQRLGKQQDERQRVFRQVDALYHSNPFTVGAVARCLGCDIIQAWSHLSANHESRIISSSGKPSERDAALRLLDTDNLRLVIDPISLMTIHALKLEDEVIQTVGRLGIVQATIDLVTGILLKRTSISRRGFMTLTKEADSFVRREVTQEQVAAHLLSLEGLIRWIETNCDVIPWSPALATKREERKELAEVTGEESLDTVLSASGPARAIYSDDLRLRQLAKAEFNVDGIATQPILMRAVNKRVIDRDRYNKAVVQLAAAGYVHTSIDAHVLLEAAKQSNWSAVAPFTDVTWLLNGMHCDENSAVRVAADFLRLLWQQSMLPRSTDYLVFQLLDELASGRNPFQVSEKLLVALSQRFALIPIAEVELSKLIRTWRAFRVG